MAHHDLSARQPAAPLQYARVLVAESDPALRALLQTPLATAGYEVLLADNGKAAREAAEAAPPDLALVDTSLPDGSSLETAAFLKSLSGGGFLPVLLVGETGEGEGADGVVCLPLQPADLLRQVKSLLSLRRLCQALTDSLQEVQASYETVLRSEAKYRALVQETAEGLLLIQSQDGIITDANPCALSLLGYASHRLIGQPLAPLCPPEDDWAARLLQCARHGAAFPEEEIVLLCARGERVPIVLNAFPVNWGEGACFLLCLHDLRPVQERNRQRENTVRQAAVTETALTVSHEINNPLFVITSNVELLQNLLYEEDASVRARLNRIAELCRRIQAFTEQLGAVTHPVSKEYLPGVLMLDLEGSGATSEEDVPS